MSVCELFLCKHVPLLCDKDAQILITRPNQCHIDICVMDYEITDVTVGTYVHRVSFTHGRLVAVKHTQYDCVINTECIHMCIVFDGGMIFFH